MALQGVRGKQSGQSVFRLQRLPVCAEGVYHNGKWQALLSKRIKERQQMRNRNLWGDVRDNKAGDPVLKAWRLRKA
ncbi:hypothetical protein GV827_20265 [Sulfitobacter sp. JBTF-M27]|uniref:Uncharacterized protein n=1 Tax=Sulfitobacter sediminilitoris TaxID=2698830 RepID=A0A6P0CJM9_9RHOB|nr:hypothetical protein [Sulfitobacter sediminilitoris]NEK24713.1 hypothetical protein [Sulfitobacter sediminilitoris]